MAYPTSEPAPHPVPAPDPVPATTKPFLRSRLPRIVAASTAFLLVLLGVTLGVGKAAYDHVNAQITHEAHVLQTTDPAIRQPALQLHAENYLVIGSDTRVGQTGLSKSTITGARSDTTMLVHLSPNHKNATIVSIPRDSYVSIPSCKDSKGVTHAAHKALFNTAFDTGGAACTVGTVQLLTGIKINHFVAIDFDGFKNVINALGSVTICSPTAVSVHDKYSHITLKAGNNKLDGAQALQYVRLRHGVADGSDISRIKRQQRFLGAVLREAQGGSLLANPAKLTAFLNAATKAVTVDSGTSILDLKRLFDVLRGLDPKHVTFYTAPIARENFDPANPSSTHGSHVLLDSAKGKILYDEIIADSKITTTTTTTAKAAAKPATSTAITVAPSKITVAVTNGTTTANLATKTQAALSARGFTAGALAKVPQKATTTVVEYTAAQAVEARTVAAALPNATMKLVPTLSGPITVIVGSKFTKTLAVKVGQTPPAWVKATAAPTAAAKKTPTGGISAADTKCTNNS